MASDLITSPPAAKRQRLETNGSDQPEASSSSVPHGNGDTATSNGNSISVPVASSAPVVAPAPVEEDEEPEEVIALEDEVLAHRDMYLDTVRCLVATCNSRRSQLTAQVDRSNLDFDFERLCSKSLSNINVYACLVCGKYFQGRGKGSFAYRHAVGDNHRVWLNLATEKVSS
jgi:U4/U6.U5 tri-snRNP-associated protein 2